MTDHFGVGYRPMVDGMPGPEQVVEHRIELFLRRVPRLEEVVVQVDHVDGVDGGTCIGVGGQQDAPSGREEVHRLLQEIDAVHLRHPVIRQQQRYHVTAQFQFPKCLQSLIARLGPDDPIVPPVGAAQISSDGAGHLGIVINGQDHGTRLGHQDRTEQSGIASMGPRLGQPAGSHPVALGQVFATPHEKFREIPGWESNRGRPFVEMMKRWVQCRTAREEKPMTQYLLAVHSVEGEAPPSARGDAADVPRCEQFNAELQAKGAWVFTGGLTPSHRHRGPLPAWEVLMTDGPFAEGKEHLGGFWIIEAPIWTPRWPGPRKGHRRLPAPSRCGRSRNPRGLTRRGRDRGTSSASSVRSTGGPCRSWSACSVTSTSPRTRSRTPSPGAVARGRRRAAAEPGRLDHHHRPEPGHRPAAAGSLPRDRHAQAALLHARERSAEGGNGPVRDDRLRLIFTCCHPALGPAAQVALTLRLLGGLTRPRSRMRSWCPSRPWPSGWSGPRARSVTPGSPTGSRVRRTCPAACAAVLAVVYLIFNEGYTASTGEDLLRPDLCAEAIRLGRLLAQLMPDEPEVLGLLALIC